MATLRRALAASASALALAHAARAQAADARCDSIIAAAAIDRVPSALYVSVRRVDGGVLDDAQADRMALNVGAGLVTPRPFRLNVFAGPSLMRGLRALTIDPAPVPRRPTLTGIYRAWFSRASRAAMPRVIRTAMMPGFDTAAVDAIVAAAQVPGVFAPPPDEDSMRVDIVFSTDSLPRSRRLASASFPRMPVVDAAPVADNPAPVLPPEIRNDTAAAIGPVLLRFVVTRDGYPAAGTVEVLRTPSVALLDAALRALESQRFSPATIRGCAVAQQVEYPFVFVPEGPGAR